MVTSEAPPYLRRAVLGDASALASLAGELGYPTDPAEMTRRLEALPPDDDVWVATVGDEVVGWGHCSVRLSLVVEPSIEILGIVVGERWRGRGIGRMLMERAERSAIQRGLSAVRLRSGSHREEAHGFYRALGYREIKQQRVFVRELET
jgi:ribosomal protein S18 acetylase RimI-like enzyme